MTFPANVYLLAIVGAFLASSLSLPFWRWFCLKAGLVDDPGSRKIHHTVIPLAGGLAVATGLVAPLLAGYAAIRFGLVESASRDLLDYGFGRRAWQLVAICGGAVGMLLLGIIDDRWELKPAAKFAGQLAIAALVAAAGVRITLFVESAVFSYAITIFWILTLTNAFNFMDNMNGLCAGIGAIGASYFAFAAASKGQYLVALLALLVAGALIGFLPFNFPKATAFLGDSGSHIVGFLLAVLAILPHFYTSESPTRAAVLSPLLILAVPLADLVWVVSLRWRMGKPFYIGDTNHLSHQLVQRGLSRQRAVLLLWLAAAAIGALAVIPW